MSRVPSPFIAPTLARIYSIVNVLQLRDVAAHPACTGSYAFIGTITGLLIALVVEAVAIAAYYSNDRSKIGTARGWVQQTITFAGFLAMTIAIIIYPLVATTSLQTLNCIPTSLPLSQLYLLDGGTSISASAVNGHVVVYLWASDPVFVCFAGSHAPAGVMAAIDLTLFTIGFPILIFRWLVLNAWRRQRPARRQSGNVRNSDATSKRKLMRRNAGGGSELRGFTGSRDRVMAIVSHAEARTRYDTSNSRTLRALQSLRRILTNAQSVILASSSVDLIVTGSGRRIDLQEPDKVLSPFLADYIPTAWYFKHLDLIALCGMAALDALASPPANLAVNIGRAVVASVLLLPLAAFVLLHPPYLAEDDWKGHVKFMVSYCV